MNTRMLTHTLRLFLLFLFSFCTICFLPAQEQSLRDPKAITIEDISLNDFLKQFPVHRLKLILKWSVFMLIIFSSRKDTALIF